MEQYATQQGNRPDLAGLPVNLPEGYIGNLVYPPMSMHEKAGEFSYMGLHTDQTPETSRTRGDELSRAFLVTQTASWLGVSRERRVSVDWRDVKLFGGVEVADRHGGTMAKRAIMRQREDLQAAALFAGTSTAISSDPLKDVMLALPEVKRFAGSNAMVLSYSAWLWLVSQEAVYKKLRTFGWQGPNTAAVLSVQREVVISMLQNVYGITQVLIGDDDHWETHDGHMAIVKLPDAGEMSHLEGAILGKTIQYIPDPDKPDGIEIVSAPNYPRHCNDYDGVAFYNVVEFSENTGAKVLFTGLREET